MIDGTLALQISRDTVPDLATANIDFDKICDDFTNKKIFKVNQAGDLIKDDNGSLIKNNYETRGRQKCLIIRNIKRRKLETMSLSQKQ